MRAFPSRHDWRLSWEALPILLRVRWRLWRTPFPVLHAQWRAQVQAELDAALQNPARRRLRTGGKEQGTRLARIARSDEAGSPSPPAPVPHLFPNLEVWACAHAVERVASLVPLASCLTRAMTLQLLLARRGQEGAVCIGVERRKAATPEAATPEAADASARPAPLANDSDLADGRFRAHAWVEWNGRVLIGGDVRRWKPLTLFAPVSAPAPRS